MDDIWCKHWMQHALKIMTYIMCEQREQRRTKQIQTYFGIEIMSINPLSFCN